MLRIMCILWSVYYSSYVFRGKLNFTTYIWKSYYLSSLAPSSTVVKKGQDEGGQDKPHSDMERMG